MTLYDLNDDTANELAHIIEQKIKTLEQQLEQNRTMLQGLKNPKLPDKLPKQQPNLTKDNIIIPRFTHDPALEKSYRTLFYYEHPDGRVVLRYMAGLLYSTKERLKQIPYPVPLKLLANMGFSGN